MSKKVIYQGGGVSVSNNHKLLAGESAEKAIYITIDEPFYVDKATFARFKEILIRDTKIKKIVSKKRNIQSK